MPSIKDRGNFGFDGFVVITVDANLDAMCLDLVEVDVDVAVIVVVSCGRQCVTTHATSMRTEESGSAHGAGENDAK